MSSLGWSLARAGTTVVVAGGLVYAATTVPFTASLTPDVERAAAAPVQLGPVTATALTCPGPETEGLAGVPAVAGTTTVYAASAPSAALEGVDLPAGTGGLALTSPSAAAALASGSERGRLVQAAVSGPTAASVAAQGSLAPGLAALQTTVVTDGDDRAAVTAPCQTPRAELWLVAGGGSSTRRERVVLANPGANPVSADVTVLGAAGPLASANGQHVAVPPNGRTSLLVDALVGPESTPVVHVVATGGALTGVVEDSWVDGATGRGADDASPAAEPATEQVVPGAFVDGPARLRVAVPGDTEAVVQTRALTKDGPIALPDGGVQRIPAGAVREVDLGALPAGAYAVQVRADHPVVAGVITERRPSAVAQSDFAWATSTQPVGALAGTPLPQATSAALMLVATGEPGAATVYTVGEDGAVQTRPFTLPTDTVAAVDVTGARQVWVGQSAGTVRASVAVSLGLQDASPLYSLVPLNPSVLTATQVPVRQVPY